MVVSWYYFQKDIKQIQYQGIFEQLCINFMNDHSKFCQVSIDFFNIIYFLSIFKITHPYLYIFSIISAMWSPYWEHVKTAWAIRHKPNILFLFYEDLIKVRWNEIFYKDLQKLKNHESEKLKSKILWRKSMDIIKYISIIFYTKQYSKILFILFYISRISEYIVWSDFT